MNKKKSPKFDLILQHKPIFDRMDADAVANVIKSGWISEGKETKKFQENYRKFVGTKYAVATTSGTAAIFLSLSAVGIQPGDEVIVPNITFVATAMAVRMIGAKVVLADIDENNFTISNESIKKKITKKTKAIIPVHLNGRSTDLDELKEICNKFNLKLIEDASQSLGSKYGDKYLGSIGDTGAFSLAPTKIITTGQGGMITTNSFEIYEMLRKIKDQGRSDKSDNHEIVGYNLKFSDLQAALGNSQFSKLRERLAWMKKIHKMYTELLEKNTFITIPQNRPETQLWYFDILHHNRDKLVEYMEKFNIIGRRFYKPINEHLPFKTKEKFPISSRISSKGIYLPSSVDLTIPQVKYICEVINSFH